MPPCGTPSSTWQSYTVFNLAKLHRLQPGKVTPSSTWQSYTVFNLAKLHLYSRESSTRIDSSRIVASVLRQKQEGFYKQARRLAVVIRLGLWSILSKLGCPPKIIGTITPFHHGIMAVIVVNCFVPDPS